MFTMLQCHVWFVTSVPSIIRCRIRYYHISTCHSTVTSHTPAVWHTWYETDSQIRINRRSAMGSTCSRRGCWSSVLLYNNVSSSCYCSLPNGFVCLHEIASFACTPQRGRYVTAALWNNAIVVYCGFSACLTTMECFPSNSCARVNAWCDVNPVLNK